MDVNPLTAVFVNYMCFKISFHMFINWWQMSFQVCLLFSFFIIYEKMCFLGRSYSRIWIYQLIEMFFLSFWSVFKFQSVALKEQWAYMGHEFWLNRLIKNYRLKKPILQHFVGSKELLNWLFKMCVSFSFRNSYKNEHKEFLWQKKNYLDTRYQYLKAINLFLRWWRKFCSFHKCCSKCILQFKLKQIRWRRFWRVIRWSYYWWYSCLSALICQQERNWDNHKLMFNGSIVKLQMHWMFLTMKKLQSLILISSLIRLNFSDIYLQTAY